MSRPSPVSIFLAASALAVASSVIGPAHSQEAGGLKEWTTDQGVDEKSKPDADAAALQKKAEEEDVCIPVGEGENCW